MTTNVDKKRKRQMRGRKKIVGTAQRPRLSIFKSNKHIYVQLIDDELGKTLVALSDKKLESQKSAEKLTKLKKAELLGEKLAHAAEHKKLKEIVFDRSGYRYHGRVRGVAQGARKGGMSF